MSTKTIYPTSSIVDSIQEVPAAAPHEILAAWDTSRYLMSPGYCAVRFSNPNLPAGAVVDSITCLARTSAVDYTGDIDDQLYSESDPSQHVHLLVARTCYNGQYAWGIESGTPTTNAYILAHFTDLCIQLALTEVGGTDCACSGYCLILTYHIAVVPVRRRTGILEI